MERGKCGTRSSECGIAEGFCSALRTPNSALDQQSRHHGHGRAAGELRKSAQSLAHPERALGGGIGARKITISTSGLVPQIRRLADEPEQFRLAISLHGATDEVRQRIMPVNRKYPLKELTAALEYYQAQKTG